MLTNMLLFREKGINFLVPKAHGYNGLEHCWQEPRVSAKWYSSTMYESRQH